MADKVRKRKTTVCILLGVILFMGIFLFYQLAIITDRTESFDKEYKTWYNRITKTTAIQHTSSGTVSCFGNRGRPSLLWSPGSHVLAVTNGGNGNRRTEMIDFTSDMATGIIPTKSDIQKALGQVYTAEGIDTRIEVTKWLDGNNVLVEFSWPHDELGQPILGWLVFDLSACAIRELVIA